MTNGLGRPVRALAVLVTLGVAWCAAAGADDIQRIVELRQQFDAQYQAGRYREAEKLSRQILALVERAFAEQPAAIAIWLNNTALLNDNLGRYAEAEALYKRALVINEKAYGRNHNNVAINLNNLAELYRKQGRYAEADPLYKRTLAIQQKALEPGDPSIAITANNLGLLYMAQGRYGEAEPFFKRAQKSLNKSPAPDQPLLAIVVSNLALVHDHLGRYVESEDGYKQALAIREDVLEPQHPDVAVSLHNLAALYVGLGRYTEAEPLYRRALDIQEKSLGAEHPNVASCLTNLGTLCSNVGRFREAEQLLKRALAIGEKALGKEHPGVAMTLNDLGCLFDSQGRYAEAESLLKRSLAIREKALGPSHPLVARSLNNLATMYDDLGRYAEAEPYYKRSLAIYKESFGSEHPDVAMSLNNLAEFYRGQGRYREAEPLYEQCLAIKRKVYEPGNPDIALTISNLGLLYQNQGRYADAEPLYRQALKTWEDAYGPDHPDVTIALGNLATLCELQSRYEEAESLVNRLITLRDRIGASPWDRFTVYYFRARLAWTQGRKKEAVADLKQALDLADQQRSQVAGAEHERAEFFARFAEAFEHMVAWQTELGDVNEALAAIERSRARVLVDQMGAHGLDLLAGVPPDEAESLRRRESDAQSLVASLAKQLRLLPTRKDLSPEERKAQQATFEEQLRQARWDYVRIYADIRNASPVYRLALGNDLKPIELPKLQAWVAEQDALLLEYLLGSDGGYLLVVAAGAEPRLEKLQVGEQQAQALGVAPGPLTEPLMRTILSGEGQAGVLQQLKSSDEPERLAKASPRLAALWQLLVPQAEREALASDKYKRLILIPGAALSRLPFEALVIRTGDDPRYVLDVAPPIEYAPSATILVNLAQRESRAAAAARQPVLTVGNPNYRQSTAPATDSMLAQLLPTSRYVTSGGSLAQLPYSGWESTWVRQVFDRQGIQAARLSDKSATESAVRDAVTGRRVVHLACHGLVDESYGNLFGALALTPGSNPQDPADDGFLTLAEIYELDLDNCELAILSACDTNYGPLQRGEGVWALSRGFLVAGSRRVVASNWLVDDEAAASLISVFCSSLARTEQQGEPVDYAKALQKAKRWVRQEEKWKSPFYWGTFVLVGPN